MRQNYTDLCMCRSNKMAISNYPFKLDLVLRGSFVGQCGHMAHQLPTDTFFCDFEPRNSDTEISLPVWHSMPPPIFFVQTAVSTSPYQVQHPEYKKRSKWIVLILYKFKLGSCENIIWSLYCWWEICSCICDTIY